MIVKRIGVLSVGKVIGGVYAIVGLLVGIPLSLTAIFSPLSSELANLGPITVITGIGAAILLPLGYGIGSFLIGVLVAALYNLVAGRFGGIDLTIE